MRIFLTQKDDISKDEKSKLLLQKYLEDWKRLHDGITRSFELHSKQLIEAQRTAQKAYEIFTERQKQFAESVQNLAVVPDVVYACAARASYFGGQYHWCAVDVEANRATNECGCTISGKGGKCVGFTTEGLAKKAGDAWNKS